MILSELSAQPQKNGTNMISNSGSITRAKYLQFNREDPIKHDQRLNQIKKAQEIQLKGFVPGQPRSSEQQKQLEEYIVKRREQNQKFEQNLYKDERLQKKKQQEKELLDILESQKIFQNQQTVESNELLLDSDRQGRQSPSIFEKRSRMRGSASFVTLNREQANKRFKLPWIDDTMAYDNSIRRQNVEFNSRSTQSIVKSPPQFRYNLQTIQEKPKLKKMSYRGMSNIVRNNLTEGRLGSPKVYSRTKKTLKKASSTFLIDAMKQYEIENAQYQKQLKIEMACYQHDQHLTKLKSHRAADNSDQKGASVKSALGVETRSRNSVCSQNIRDFGKQMGRLDNFPKILMQDPSKSKLQRVESSSRITYDPPLHNSKVSTNSTIDFSKQLPRSNSVLQVSAHKKNSGELSPQAYDNSIIARNAKLKTFNTIGIDKQRGRDNSFYRINEGNNLDTKKESPIPDLILQCIKKKRVKLQKFLKKPTLEQKILMGMI